VNLREYGNPSDAEWQQKSLGDVSGILQTLCERECEHMEEHDTKTYGEGALAVRLDLVEKARELIDVAEAGNLKIMREVWRKTCKR
jgi:hypothetical protein